MAPFSHNEIADYLILSFRDSGENLTNLKLQKLLYYAQAWYLANHGKPLIDCDFQAWTHGPVCRPLYLRFKGYEWKPITEKVESPNLPTGVVEFLDELKIAYGDFGAWALERMVHVEEPWLEARGGLPLDASCNKVIPRDTMERYYRSRLEEEKQNTAS